jgi:hypothetical protein
MEKLYGQHKRTTKNTGQSVLSQLRIFPRAKLCVSMFGMHLMLVQKQSTSIRNQMGLVVFQKYLYPMMD